ncbi:FecR family protein [Sphingobacterium alkalisoli]|uniref:FecR family protein n=1 Tax=Sphingobacterium alkalisoli TaxID=1874115 RepID=A0A4U0H5S9_9SPHI|nr:FecR family protein [Sphingobacterium alkalisoli]TJY67105.1 FecR family protein [Sphingobacterium alkalisoli]GGH12189.1 hypothetical protein GCM10011418_11570 [Sphingobacterium alkalisoli]
MFTLPDGTKVWLNADSKISFALQFIKKTREIILDGEAYFEVSKDKDHPFIVKSNGQQIEVLGTQFNVNSYRDEPTTAKTLVEGNRVDFRTAMRKIARWYNVEVVYDTSVPEEMESGGWMSRNNKLSGVLQAIEDAGHAQFKIEGKKSSS